MKPTPVRKIPPQTPLAPPPADTSNQRVKWDPATRAWIADTMAELHTEGRTFKPRKAANPHESP